MQRGLPQFLADNEHVTGATYPFYVGERYEINATSFRPIVSRDLQGIGTKGRDADGIGYIRISPLNLVVADLQAYDADTQQDILLQLRNAIQERAAFIKATETQLEELRTNAVPQPIPPGADERAREQIENINAVNLHNLLIQQERKL